MFYKDLVHSLIQQGAQREHEVDFGHVQLYRQRRAETATVWEVCDLRGNTGASWEASDWRLVAESCNPVEFAPYLDPRYYP